MRKPILTLTTDFGSSDHYVGAMKGVILDICPQAEIVDITHEIPAYEIAEGAFTVSQAYRYFPKKTIHVVVVDPGVGSARRPILMEAAGHYFVAPDNGVLGLIYSENKHRVRIISNEFYFRKPVSRTFHGRDIFAPVAAHLACGTPGARFGKIIQDYVRPAFEKPQPNGKNSWRGRILKIDRFGNCITNFRECEFPRLSEKSFSLAIGMAEICGMANNYSDCKSGALCLIAGSSGYLEVSVNQGSAAKVIGCQTGSVAELTIW
ncbi:MAG TPA: SAM-dependent chlorinase/fluorinase [Bryobacteraceae bacterium]|nr:SAM-dependent chlorinase/fluorinase [Bryobacteraceae bacterium]